jgi:hypothetical protein
VDEGDAAPESGLEPRDEDERVGQEGEVAQERREDGFAGFVSGDDYVPVAIKGCQRQTRRDDATTREPGLVLLGVK